MVAGGQHQTLPFAIFGVAVLCLVLLPLVSDATLTHRNVYDIFQTFAEYGLLALALGVSMIAGEYDLSTASMYGLAGMVAVLTGTDTPALGIALALAVGLFVGLVQGTIVARLRMSSIPVTLGGFIINLGITLVLSDSKDVTYERISTALSLDAPIAGVFSLYSLITIGAFLALALALHFSRLGTDIRAIGGDREASRSAGVKVGWMLVTVFAISGVGAAAAGSLHAYSVSAAQPNLGFAPLIFATIAALLGGVSLAGGRGSVAGIAAGILTLATLQEILTMVSAPEYISNLVTGGLLLVVTILGAPTVVAWWRRRRPPGSVTGGLR